MTYGKPNGSHPPLLLGTLTPRERDILRLMAQDLSNAEIAERLVMTLGTVKWYVKELYSKLDVHSRDDAIARAAELNLAPQAQPVPPTPTNLPAPTTSLVGRKHEIAAVRQRMLREDVRLLTLIGTPGIGKTRLSLETAAALLSEFPDGVYFVLLAPLSDPALVANAIGGILGVQEMGGQSITEMLKHYLCEKRLLLVLDNFEHLLSAAPLVSELLAAAPKLKVLATSREALRLYGEQEYPVPPLALPDPKHSDGIETLGEYEAVALFVRRAQAVRPEFDLTQDNALAIVAICARLDGLPLAIELAAARMKLHSPNVLFGRLHKCLSMLTGGARDVPERQQTLRGAIAWSFDLLNEGEKTLFARLGVFVGGWSLEAMEAVRARASHDSPLQVDVYDALESLLNKSLVQQIEGANGEPRFTMLETLREFALEKLAESGEEEVIRRAHADYFGSLVERAKQTWRTPEQRYWLDYFDSEFDNLRAALHWYHEAPDGIEPELGMIGGLGWLWFFRSHFTEAQQWMEAGLARGGDVAPRVRAEALLSGGYGAAGQANVDKARALLSSAMSIIPPISDPRELAFYRHCRAALKDNLVEAIGDYEELLAQARSVNDTWMMSNCSNNLGNRLKLCGDFDGAKSAYEEGLRWAQQYGYWEDADNNLCNLAVLEFDHGHRERAKQLCQQYLSGDQRDKGLPAFIWLILGDIAHEETRYPEALAYYHDALELARVLDDLPLTIDILCAQGTTVLALGDLERAMALHRESLGMAAQIKRTRGIAHVLEHYATTTFAAGGTLKAARLLAAAHAVRQSAGTPNPPVFEQRYRATITEIQNQLDADTFEAAWREGLAMTLDAAVVYALEDE